jgi:hypothetical protein
MFYDRYHDMINLYRISELQLPFVELTHNFILTDDLSLAFVTRATQRAWLVETGTIHPSVPPTCVHPRF